MSCNTIFLFRLSRPCRRVPVSQLTTWPTGTFTRPQHLMNIFLQILQKPSSDRDGGGGGRDLCPDRAGGPGLPRGPEHRPTRKRSYPLAPEEREFLPLKPSSSPGFTPRVLLLHIQVTRWTTPPPPRAHTLTQASLSRSWLALVSMLTSSRWRWTRRRSKRTRRRS